MRRHTPASRLGTTVLCALVLTSCGPPESANGDLGVLVFQLRDRLVLDPTQEAIAVGTTLTISTRAPTPGHPGLFQNEPAPPRPVVGSLLVSGTATPDVISLQATQATVIPTREGTLQVTANAPDGSLLDTHTFRVLQPTRLELVDLESELGQVSFFDPVQQQQVTRERSVLLDVKLLAEHDGASLTLFGQTPISVSVTPPEAGSASLLYEEAGHSRRLIFQAAEGFVGSFELEIGAQGVEQPTTLAFTAYSPTGRPPGMDWTP